ncbi:MAG: hypothetical protein UY99_C0036G0005 [Parcubacteria group bacterium GW2011_GWA1_59_11]|nr:MAG: hypothetical protein UY99_C0036G0005 [Parcubacteria group bacterium GW2011_GWA1_59_11]
MTNELQALHGALAKQGAMPVEVGDRILAWLEVPVAGKFRLSGFWIGEGGWLGLELSQTLDHPAGAGLEGRIRAANSHAAAAGLLRILLLRENSPRLSVFTAIRPRDGEEMTAEVCERELLRIAEAVRQIWPELLPID